MAIYSGFSQLNMVIFHSYVSLPEGTLWKKKNIAMEDCHDCHLVRWFTYYKRWFAIAMLVYQKGEMVCDPFLHLGCLGISQVKIWFRKNTHPRIPEIDKWRCRHWEWGISLYFTTKHMRIPVGKWFRIHFLWFGLDIAYQLCFAQKEHQANPTRSHKYITWYETLHVELNAEYVYACKIGCHSVKGLPYWYNWYFVP